MRFKEYLVNELVNEAESLEQHKDNYNKGLIPDEEAVGPFDSRDDALKNAAHAQGGNEGTHFVILKKDNGWYWSDKD